MHPDLSSHLHTEKCNELIRLLRECRNQHSFTKFFGFCNSFYMQMTRCLKDERQARRLKNYEESEIRKKKLKKLMTQDKKREYSL
ncbi:hypothetical protein NQ315_016149 [Exocentrus adspersus]|uniref:COX assembly mitochondrial protein n=1 Tax=Exocentrus adspersus TaxID=1586481 RepID=A0AAV8VGV1_9CUCU|nr:hypothetical protein NQ315_016149 [Exocentrus adspersus]